MIRLFLNCIFTLRIISVNMQSHIKKIKSIHRLVIFTPKFDPALIRTASYSDFMGNTNPDSGRTVFQGINYH
jgi:hypothetical protein